MDIFLKCLPEIASLLVGLVGAIVTFLITKYKGKKKQVELEIEKIELQKAVIENTMIICPTCKSKFKLKDAKIVEKEEL